YTWNWIGTSYVHPEKFDPKKEIHLMTPAEIVKQILELSSDISRIVVSGGEPMLQQPGLIEVFQLLRPLDYTFEVETNGTIAPLPTFLSLVDQINCSPKLENSGPDNPQERRINPEALTPLANSEKVYFKFVVTDDRDLREIQSILKTFNIQNKQVYLMPEGRTREEQQNHQKLVYDLCMFHGYNFSPRLHILIHDTKRGV
ncbi:MAG: 7-carboxy-7-deazaguanine synthase QueE, partial [Nitrosotalea sp.]